MLKSLKDAVYHEGIGSWIAPQNDPYALDNFQQAYNNLSVSRADIFPGTRALSATHYALKIFPKNEDFTVDIDGLVNYCKEVRAKALIFSNPCNPTSLGIPREEVLKIIRGFDGLVIVDEAYMDFWTQSVLDSVNDCENLIVLKTCSKFIGLAAVRLGFAVSGKTVTNALKAAKSPYNTDSISQLIGETVLREKDYLNAQKEKILKDTQYLYGQLCGLKVPEFAGSQRFGEEKRNGGLKVPEFAGNQSSGEEKRNGGLKVCRTRANFVFVEMPNSGEIYRYLLKNGIAVRHFDGFLRICAGTETEIDVLLDRLKELWYNED
jgi:histidinol-phosphate aminotransferase